MGGGGVLSGDSREQPLIGECDSVPRSFIHRECADYTQQGVSSPARSARMLFESRELSSSVRPCWSLCVCTLGALHETKRGREESGAEREGGEESAGQQQRRDTGTTAVTFL